MKSKTCDIKVPSLRPPTDRRVTCLGTRLRTNGCLINQWLVRSLNAPFAVSMPCGCLFALDNPTPVLTECDGATVLGCFSLVPRALLGHSECHYREHLCWTALLSSYNLCFDHDQRHLKWGYSLGQHACFDYFGLVALLDYFVEES